MFPCMNFIVAKSWKPEVGARATKKSIGTGALEICQMRKLESTDCTVFLLKDTFIYRCCNEMRKKRKKTTPAEFGKTSYSLHHHKQAFEAK